MASTGFNVNDIKTALADGGARPTLFEIGGSFSGTNFLLHCRAASLPGTNINVIPVNYRGRAIKLPGVRTYDVWNTTFLNDDGEEIKNKLQGRLSQDCVLCTDGQKAYNPFCYEQNILHKVLSGHQVIDKTFHINTVNAYHSRLKNWHRRFHGTATKYLANYLGWFRALEVQKYEKLNTFKLLALQ
jgi:hypothetical protein